MDPNTHSTQQPATGLDCLAAVVDQLATEDPDALPDAPTTAPRPSPPPAGCATAPGWATRRPPARPGRPRPAPRPLAETAKALATGELGHLRAAALPRATQELPVGTAAAAAPVLLAAARRLDPPRLRKGSATCVRWPTRRRRPAGPAVA